MVNEYIGEEKEPGETFIVSDAAYMLFELNNKEERRSYIAVDLAIKRIRIVSW